MNKNKNKNRNSIKDKVLADIKKGKLDMRPKAHFVLKSALVFLGMFFAILSVLYLGSFIIYFVKQTGLFYLPAYGWKGLVAFLKSFPWLIVSLGVLLIVFAERISKEFSLVYTNPLVYSVVGILIFVLMGSYLINVAGFHKVFYGFSERHRIPPFDKFYRHYDKDFSSKSFFGRIININEDRMKVKVASGQVVDVFLTPKTRLPKARKLREKDKVFVFARWTGEKIYAFGIKLLPPAKRLPDFKPKFPKKPARGSIPHFDF